MEQVKLLLSQAHAEFRRLRSGELGDTLRSQGIDYKIIWGLESYRLKEIAETLRSAIKDTTEAEALAIALWEEDIRESKMLATRLFPTSSFNPSMAETWGDAVPYTELADQLCMNLLSRVSFASSLAEKWINEDEMKQYMALQLALRLDLMQLKPQAEIIAADNSHPMWLRTAAQRLSR